MARWVVAVIALVGCGRVAFDPIADGAHGGDDSLAHVAVFAAHPSTARKVDTFTAQAQAAGDLVLFHVECSSAAPTAVDFAAPGWTITPLGPLMGTGSSKWIASYAAVAPDTSPATFTVTWTSGVNCPTLDELADEFSGAAVDQHAEAVANGICSGSVMTTTAGDAVWAACSSGGTLTGVGPGETKSADDGRDDWSAFKLTTDPANTAETMSFTNTVSSMYAITLVSMSPN